MTENAAAPAAEAALPRVLLVEDDAAIRQFVAMALEELPLQLVPCPTLGAARRQLKLLAPALVLLDMMLPDGSGLELLQERGPAAASGTTHWVLFSASVSPVQQADLSALGVRQVLVKPVTLSALLACVRAALQAHGAGSASGPGPEATAGSDRTPAGPGSVGGAPDGSPNKSPNGSPDGSPVVQEAAIRGYFDGDAGLFEAVRSRSVVQFTRDIADGDAALSRGDALALRRVAHSLKTVLRMLAHPHAADIAQALEAAAERDERPLCADLWGALRGRLERLAAG